MRDGSKRSGGGGVMDVGVDGSACLINDKGSLLFLIHAVVCERYSILYPERYAVKMSLESLGIHERKGKDHSRILLFPLSKVQKNVTQFSLDTFLDVFWGRVCVELARHMTSMTSHKRHVSSNPSF